MKQVAIIGSPNCGKTTLFNRLTGTRQRTGNWPGVTVERKDGTFSLDQEKINLVDLPGIYSLEGGISGLDAVVARDYLLQKQAELVILVLDATQLPRQLMLLPQLQSMGVPLVIVVNMLDSARREGIHIDLDALQKKTGIPVVGISASTGEGVPNLKQTLADCFERPEMMVAYNAGLNVRQLASEVSDIKEGVTITERLDRWILHPVLALPIFLLVMYLLFSIAVNVGAVFIDFFDILMGSWVVDGSRWLLSSLGSPEWLTALLSDGVGGGIQLVSTFIPVIGCLYLCMSFLEDSGYLSRAAFVIDGMMARVGLPGQAFIPLIVGFGCNVPSVMATRALDKASARLTTIFIAPFMSCGARLSVYVFVGTAMFPNQAQNAIFLLYLTGIIVAVFSAWLLRKSLFVNVDSHTITEMPAYHKPLMRNVFTQSWQRLHSFIFRAGKRIMAVVVILSVISSVGNDGSWGNENTENSLLASIGKSLTPMFEPIGIGENNWPATVGLFTGLFAKEVVVGTLDTLYTPPEKEGPSGEMPDFGEGFSEATGSVASNLADLSSTFLDPLGLGAGDISELESAAEDQGVQLASYQAMSQLFPSAWAAFCFLAFILLYAPCVATIGVMHREAGAGWLQFSVVWSLLLSYWLASNLWHLSRLTEAPVDVVVWVAGSSLCLYLCYKLIAQRVRRQYANEIAVVNL